MLKIIYGFFSRKRISPAVGPALGEMFSLPIPSLMHVAAMSLVFQTRPVISCDLEIQMFPGLDFTAQNNEFY